jgi:hypothetical protein
VVHEVNAKFNSKEKTGKQKIEAISREKDTDSNLLGACTELVRTVKLDWALRKFATS